MTVETGARNRSRVGPAGRVAVLVTVAAVTAPVPAAAAAGQARPAGDRTLVAGDISTVAGGKGPGPAPAPATSVAFSPCGASVTAGTVYAAAGETVRQVSPQGVLTTPAGTGSFGPLGDGGPAARANLASACGTAVDGSGNLIIADDGDFRVRAVAATTGTFYGQAMTAGDIYTIAGNGRIGLSGDGGPATAAEFFDPRGVVADAAGNLVIADTENDRIRVLAASTGTFYGLPMTAGDVYTVAGVGGSSGLGDGGPAITARLTQPAGVALDRAGNVVIADTSDHRIRVVAVRTGTFYDVSMTAGDIYTVAGGGTSGLGDGGPATAAELDSPIGVAVDGHGNLVIGDAGQPDGSEARIRVAAAATGTFYGVSMTAGDIYTVAGGSTAGFAGDGGPATSAELNSPRAVAVNAAGDLMIADTNNNRIREVAG